MTTTTTLPLDKISQALDVLQNHGVIGDNEADHALGEWLEANGLTCADLNNYRQPRADEAQMETLATYVLTSHNDDHRDLAISLAYHLTDGERPDAVANLIADYKETLGD